MVPSLRFPQYRVITVANMTELEGKNSLLGTVDLVHKTDQQQLIQGTVRQETCTQENCITVERENYLGARDRFLRAIGKAGRGQWTRTVDADHADTDKTLHNDDK